MRQQKNDTKHSPENMADGGPFFIIISLIVVAGYVLFIKDAPRQQTLGQHVLVTALVIAQIVLLWFSPRLIFNRSGMLIYFAVQGVLAFIVGLLTPGYWLAIILYMSLTGVAVAVLWPDLRTVAVAVLLGLILSSYHLVTSWGWRGFFQFMPNLGIAIAFVVIYVGLFTRQMQARTQTQELLEELESAHRQLQAYADRVQALSIIQERQRMAQELHDTLAQGLAGLILQLEAVDSHLEDGNPAKARETAQRAMELARTTLQEARRAIQALRPVALEHNSLVDALGHEVDEFAATTGMHAAFQVDSGMPDVSEEDAQDILRIVQETLTNVARHARASHVVVRLETHDSRLRLTVQDDGKGFDPDLASGQPGSFGLRGLKERAAHLGGELAVRSAPGRGTTVILDMAGFGDDNGEIP